jgi:hypothetical protein
MMIGAAVATAGSNGIHRDAPATDSKDLAAHASPESSRVIAVREAMSAPSRSPPPVGLGIEQVAT